MFKVLIIFRLYAHKTQFGPINTILIENLLIFNSIKLNWSLPQYKLCVEDTLSLLIIIL